MIISAKDAKILTTQKIDDLLSPIYNMIRIAAAEGKYCINIGKLERFEIMRLRDLGFYTDLSVQEEITISWEHTRVAPQSP